jgi:DNA-binding transcriptional ArsR family regulator
MKKKDREKLLEASDLMKVLSHPVRLAILCDLIHYGRLSAGEIFEAQADRASQSQVSQYLAEFRRRRFVKAEKEGQNVFYTFSSPLIKSIIELLYKAYCGKGA